MCSQPAYFEADMFTSPLICFAGDVRTVDKLVNGDYNTMDDAHMWLAPVKRQLSAAAAATASQRHAAQWAALPEAVQPYNLLSVRMPAGGAWLSGLRVWNYNKSPQDTARGVKRMLVLAGGFGGSERAGALAACGCWAGRCMAGPLQGCGDLGIPLNMEWSVRQLHRLKACSAKARIEHGGSTHCATLAAVVGSA